MMKKFIANLGEVDRDSPVEDFEEAYKASGYSIGIQVAIKSFFKYYDYYLLSKFPEQCISKEDYEYVRYLCNKVNLNDKCEILKKCKFQYELYFTYKGVECKGLLDAIYIDEETKTIYPYDIKTVASMEAFSTNYTRFGYDSQAGFYTIGLEQLYPGYKIAPFVFIVIPKDDYPRAEVFEVFDISENKNLVDNLLDLWIEHKESNNFLPNGIKEINYLPSLSSGDW